MYLDQSQDADQRTMRPVRIEDDVRRHEPLDCPSLQAEQGRRERTAQRLGISPRTLRYKLAQMRELAEFSGLLEG